MGRNISTYVDNSAQSTDGIGSVDCVATASGVLHYGAGNHDDILGRIGQLLDDQEHHLSQTSIFVLEELRDAEEERGGLLRGEGLSSVEEQRNLGQQNAASSGLDWRAVEQSSCCASELASVWPPCSVG